MLSSTFFLEKQESIQRIFSVPIFYVVTTYPYLGLAYPILSVQKAGLDMLAPL